MAEFRVLITGQSFARSPGDHERRLRGAGCELVTSPYGRALSESELLPLVPGTDAVIAGTDAFTRRVFEAADRLKIVSRFGVGYDAIDLVAAGERGVWVTNTPGTNEHSVADLALTLILALARQLVPSVVSTRKGEWDRSMGIELGGQTLGLIGFGRIGRQVAIRARAFGMNVLIADVVQDERAAAEIGGRYVSLDELLAGSDFVSLHAPSLPETRNLVNAATLGKMKRTAFLVNTARGELVDEADLAEALRSGRIAGAALDVLKKEPPEKDNPLLALPNVLPTAHIAGLTLQSAERMAAVSVDNVLAVQRGERPPYPVNEPDLARRMRAGG